MFSRSCTYGIQAGLYLASHGTENKYVPAHRIAKDLGVPFHFLKKILQRLSDQGITRSVRSTNGGVALARKAEEITIWEIVEAIDGVKKFDTECILKLPECDANRPCVLHKQWLKEKSRLQLMLKSANLRDGAATVPNMIARASAHAMEMQDTDESADESEKSKE